VNFNVLVGILYIWIAACFAGAFTFLSPKAKKWITAPEYVRMWMPAVSVTFLWRGVNLLSLPDDQIVPGMANAEAMMLALTLTGMVTSGAIWIGLMVMPSSAWDKLDWARRVMVREPKKAPHMIDPIELAHAMGAYATGPGEGVSAAIREAKRIHTPAVLDS